MEYKTVSAYAADEFVERKSRFIGHIAPASTEEEAQDFIARISREHRDASHNVYASGQAGFPAVRTMGSPRAPAAFRCWMCFRRRG